MLKCFGFMMAALMNVGCGRQSERVIVTEPAPASDPAFSAVQPLVKKDCGGCHGVQAGLPVFSSGATFRASAAASEIEGGDMPPSGHPLPADDRAKLLAYLKG